MKNTIAGISLILVSVMLAAIVCFSVYVVPDVPIVLQSSGALLALFFGIRFLAKGKCKAQTVQPSP